MFRFIHAADIHLDSPFHRLENYEGAPVQDLRRATRRALENLVDLALSEEASFLLISGDLYDGDWKDYNTGLYFISQMSRLREAGIPVFIVTGNHDAANRMTRKLRLPKGVRVFPHDAPTTFRLEGLDVAIHGQGFPSPAVHENLAVRYPSAVTGCFNIGMLHTCATGREGHDPYAPCALSDLETKGYDYWALGHVHAREVLLEQPLAVFPGNIQGRNPRETGPKGCMLVSVDEQGTPEAAFRSLDVIRWGAVQVMATGLASGYDVVDEIAARVCAMLEANDNLPLIARVVVEGECRVHDELSSESERWTQEIRSALLDATGGQAWLEKLILRTSPRSTGPAPKTGPVAELLAYLEELEAHPEELEDLFPWVEDLARKLPREIKEGPEAIPLRDPQWLAHQLRHVKSMLLRRLWKRRPT